MPDWSNGGPFAGAIRAVALLLYAPETALIRRAQRTVRYLMLVNCLFLAGMIAGYLLGPYWQVISALNVAVLLWTVLPLGFAGEYFGKRILREQKSRRELAHEAHLDALRDNTEPPSE